MFQVEVSIIFFGTQGWTVRVSCVVSGVVSWCGVVWCIAWCSRDTLREKGVSHVMTMGLCLPAGGSELLPYLPRPYSPTHQLTYLHIPHLPPPPAISTQDGNDRT